MDQDQLELAIDWGTWKFVVAWAVSRNGFRSTPRPLMIDERTFEVRMMATWIDGRFVHGHELQKEAAGRRDLEIIDFFKLLLHRGPETAEITRRVEGILAGMPGNKTLDMLITEHLRAVMRDAKAALRKSSLRVAYRSDPQKLERLLENVHVRITIPQMWTPDAKRRMQVAAKNAGMRVSVLSYEPQCALAYLVDIAAQQKVQIGPLCRGDSILVADLGSGTGDFVLYELQDDLGLDSRLHCIRQSSGEICGSVKVDEALLRILKRRCGTEWYDNIRAHLDLRPNEFDRRVLVAIEEAKQKFGKEDDNFTQASIKGIAGVFQTSEIRRAEFYEAFDTVISMIVTEIDKNAWGVKPTVIQVTGGFSKCRYLMERLRARYEPRGSIVVRPNETDIADCFPVALGAVLRYDNITTPALPSQYGYILLQRQDFHEEIHTDAYIVEEDWDGTEETTYKPYIRGDPYNLGFDVVDDRIINIIRKRQVLQPNQVVISRVKQEYIVPCDNPRLSDNFAYTTTNLADDEWAKMETDVEGQYAWRPEVHHWTSVEIPLDRKRLEGRGFPLIEHDGEEFRELEARITLRLCEIAVSIGYEILKPAKWKARDGDHEAGEKLSRDVAFRVKETWEATHSEFVL